MKNVGFLPLFFSTTLASFIVDKITKASTCEPTLLQWQGGVAPWMLVVLATDETTLENLGTFKRTSFSWKVDFIAGTSVVIRALDSTGKSATSNRFTIQAGTTNCVLHEVNPPDSSLDTQPQSDSVPNALKPPSSPPSSSQAATVTVSVTTTTSLITSLSPSSRSTSSTTTTGSSSQLAASPHTSTSVNATQQTTATPPSASFRSLRAFKRRAWHPVPSLRLSSPPCFCLLLLVHTSYAGADASEHQ
ncbi:hypothetical protein B0H10DRAFT_314741 [Mycena sp. CBHHK59/15]|nr:hypothetical protein B0H10DRAFT_314741 [Mycena sp. CBHHK59/15]